MQTKEKNNRFHLFKKQSPHNYPFLNKSLSNIRGERWKPAPDFEDSYAVSSFGRIKSLARTVYYKNGKVIHKKEKIVSQRLHTTPNYHVKDFTQRLGASFHEQGKSLNFSVRRMVYHCFVEPIDLLDYSYSIICKDGNGLNVHYRNLKKVTITQQMERIYERERSISAFSYLDVKELQKKGLHKLFRQVTQYDLKGKKLKVYKSIKEAAEATKTMPALISNVLSGNLPRTGKFIYRYGDGPDEIDLTQCLERGKVRVGAWHKKKVTQYNLQGERIATYASIMDARRATGVNSSLISQCLSGILNGAKGFLWKAGEGPKKIRANARMNGKKIYRMPKKKIDQYTLDGKYLATYESIRKAAEAVGANPDSISNVVRGIYSKSKEYCWKYAV